MNAQISVSKTALAAFCQERGIKRLAIFGSALRDDFGPDSDIDLLVEFESSRIPSLLGVAGMETKLSELFAGMGGGSAKWRHLCRHGNRTV